MSEDVLALGGGILFLLVAIVGGGFTIREIVMPTVPNWARAAAAIVGIVLVVPFTLTALGLRRAEQPTSPGPDSSSPAPADQVQRGIVVDTEPRTSPHDIRLTDLAPSVPAYPARPGDTVTVTYRLTNVGDEPVELGRTFVGVRDPTRANNDVIDREEVIPLAPRMAVTVVAQVFLSSTGDWQIWPCYALANGESCPDEWSAFHVLVEEA